MSKLVDLSHLWNIHTPPWSGYPSAKIYYFQRLQDVGVVSQKIETTLHMGTHLDAPMHLGGRGDIASIPLEQLYGDGVIVDISDEVGEFDIIKPEHITKKIDVKKGDILIYHTGWMRYYTGGPDMNEETYMCKHPGGYLEMANWIVDMEFKWTGMDCGSGDHPMNTSIRTRRMDIRKQYEKKMGKSVDELFPEEHIFCMHRIPFPKNIIHVENVGGDLDKVGTVRCKIGCFPWRFEGGEAAMSRVVAWID